MRPVERRDDVEQALREERRARQLERRQPDHRHALRRVEAHVRADHLEQPRDDVDLDVLVLERADEIEGLLVRVVREGDHDAFDLEGTDDLAQALGRPEEVEVAEPRLALLGLRIDESDDVHAVLGMLAQLARDELPDLSGADDDRVLEVDVRAPTERARQRPQRRDEDDRERPEGEQALEARIGDLR